MSTQDTFKLNDISASTLLLDLCTDLVTLGTIMFNLSCEKDAADVLSSPRDADICNFGSKKIPD